MRTWVAGLVILMAAGVLLLFPSYGRSAEENGRGDKLKVGEGMEVSLEFTLRLEDGTVYDTNAGSSPLVFIQGSHKLLPSIELAIEGMSVGETRDAVIKPEDAYGLYKPEAVREIDKEPFPEAGLKEGSMILGTDSSGNPAYAWIKEVKEDTVVVDFNHPLAGRTLYFDLKVLGIRKPQGKDLR